MKLWLVLGRELRLRSWGVSNPFIIRQLIEAGLQVSITSQNSNAHHFCCVEMFFSTEVYSGWFNKHNSLVAWNHGDLLFRSLVRGDVLVGAGSTATNQGVSGGFGQTYRTYVICVFV